MDLTIKKVLNSSVVLATDAQDAELIILGKGIGYGKKPGMQVEDDIGNQWFVPVAAPQLKQVMALLEEMPSEVIEVTGQINQYAIQQLNQKLNEGLTFALMDHINFALQRLSNGMHIQNKLYWEVQNYYPEEFRIGEFSVRLINEKFNVTLPKEEIANIAFHIINVEKEGINDYDSMKVTALVDDVVSLIRYQVKNQIQTGSISYQRLITHIKFFAERLLSNQQLTGSDSFMNQHLRQKYPEATQIADLIVKFIDRKYQLTITEEELIYLIVHIERNRH
ncbi:PRD domain-containing protein [Latilactobacillus curvatus]